MFLLLIRNSQLVASLRVYLLIPEKKNYHALISLECMINFHNREQSQRLPFLNNTINILIPVFPDITPSSMLSTIFCQVWLMIIHNLLEIQNYFKRRKTSERELQTCGAASNIVNSLCKCSSNSSIAATLPHLQFKGTKLLKDIYRLNSLLS